MKKLLKYHIGLLNTCGLFTCLISIDKIQSTLKKPMGSLHTSIMYPTFPKTQADPLTSFVMEKQTNKQKQAVIWRNTCKFLDMQSLVCRNKLFYINTECSVLIVMIRIHKNILFLLPKCVLDGKMFGKGDGFPNSAETPSRRDFHAMMYYNYCQEKSAQQCFQSLSNCSGHHFPTWSTVHKWYKEFQFGGTIFEDWLLWPTCDRCYWTKHGQGEVADQRRSTNYRKCNKR